MKYIIDTYILLYWLDDPNQITLEVRNLLESSDNKVYFSMASVWEMMIKKSIGKLNFPANLKEMLSTEDIEILSIEFEHLEQIQNLAWHHKDPFDRLIIAQAKYENLKIITNDQVFKNYTEQIFWA